jgi:hypothetical protein
MPRYYFDFTDGGARSNDEEGLEFTEAAIAHREAATTLGEMAKEALSGMRQPYEAGVEVRDDEGNLSLSASLLFRVTRKAAAEDGLDETRLQMATRHVHTAEGLVERQRRIINALLLNKQPTELARAVLAEFEGALAIYRLHLGRLAGR